MRWIVAMLMWIAAACGRPAPVGPDARTGFSALTRDELRTLEIDAACGPSDLTLVERARDQALQRMHRSNGDYLAALVVYGQDAPLRAEIEAAAARCRLDGGWRAQPLDAGTLFIR